MRIIPLIVWSVCAMICIVVYLYIASKYWWLKKYGKGSDQKEFKKYQRIYYGLIAFLIFGSLIWVIVVKILHLK